MKVVIIGSGLAGLSAAITAADEGAEVMLVSACPPERSQSVLAAGGINAAINIKGEDDSPEQHFEDTLRAGQYIADPAAVRGLAENAPGLIYSLAEQGIVFSRDAEGRPDTRYFGGQKKSRTVFSKAGVGRQLVCGLSAIMRRLCAEGRVTVLTDMKFVEGIFSDTHCTGFIAENAASGELQYISCDALLLCSGGMGGLFGKNTGSVLSDGSVTASMFRSGLELADLEMLQYHPTTIETPEKRVLISEAARGEGGRLFTMKDGKRWYFMEDWYGEKGNLMPRDVVSRCIYKVCCEMGLGLDGMKQVGLDLTHLDSASVHERLKEICDITQLYLGIDPAEEIIPVYPGVHYCMGGIYTDRFHHTSIPGIYAAGECACIYHGANRLGGNSTLGAVYGGRIAAENAVRENDTRNTACRSKNSMQFIHESDPDREISIFRQKCADTADSNAENPSAIIIDIQKIMNSYLGIVRSPEQLDTGIQLLESYASRMPLFRERHVAGAVSAMNLRLLGIALLKSALFRKESRGAHSRSDYPQPDDAGFRKTVVASFDGHGEQFRTEEPEHIF